MVNNFPKINCPTCQKEMSTIYLIKEDAALQVCFKGCGAIFVDYLEYPKYLNEVEPIARLYEDREFEKADPKGIRTCPICHQPMEKYEYDDELSVYMHKCKNCESRFMDFAEYEKMAPRSNPGEFAPREPLSEVCVLVKNSQELQALREKYHPTQLTKIKQWLRKKLLKPKKGG